MRINAFGISDVGKRRLKNEDCFLINEALCLYAVADGMGGHLGGDFASSLALSTVEEVMRALKKDPDITLQETGDVKVRPGHYQSYLRYALSLASSRIFEKARENSTLRGMGTTTVAILFHDNKAYIANVGDSRAYRVRGEQIDQITRDHSLVNEQIRAGIIEMSSARGHRLKNIITRSVGFQEDVDSDIDVRVVREGDKFLLCSDGLTNLMDNDEIRDVVVSCNIEPACRQLVDIANERGGDDNITVVLVEVAGLDSEGPPTASEGEDATIEEDG